jgi:hypothetical protein
MVKELNKKFQHLPLEQDPESLLELLELLDPLALFSCRAGDDVRIAFPDSVTLDVVVPLTKVVCETKEETVILAKYSKSRRPE